MTKRASIVIAGEEVKAGSSRCVRLSLSMLHTSTPIEVPIYVFHGKKEGPVLFVTAAIHGDEINGVEIIRRLHHSPQIKRLHGTLMTIPIVNVYGFLLQSRYLPDRRDLNRQFPGTEEGSLASRLAYLLMKEVVRHSTHGIDLHTGAIHRSNYPQTRYNTSCQKSFLLAESFGAPVMLPSNLRDGSLRHATDNLDIPVIVYEAGEALRFDEFAIRLGVRGILKVMASLHMISPHKSSSRSLDSRVAVAKTSYWVRAPMSGMVTHPRPLGERVQKEDRLALIVDPLGEDEIAVLSPAEGVIIGKSNIPLTNTGDALFHLALFEKFDEPNLPTEFSED
ncbi:succinylglutamate desuccinylase/aspartoacylase family protein [Legionella israelensis]|nr:succinylglutamate desuccinylase/aspartoacylase family protein [Legionella israelensis]